MEAGLYAASEYCASVSMEFVQVLFDSIEIKPRYLVVEVEISIDQVRLIAYLFFSNNAVP